MSGLRRRQTGGILYLPFMLPLERNSYGAGKKNIDQRDGSRLSLPDRGKCEGNAQRRCAARGGQKNVFSERSISKCPLKARTSSLSVASYKRRWWWKTVPQAAIGGGGRPQRGLRQENTGEANRPEREAHKQARQPSKKPSGSHNKPPMQQKNETVEGRSRAPRFEVPSWKEREGGHWASGEHFDWKGGERRIERKRGRRRDSQAWAGTHRENSISHWSLSLGSVPDALNGKSTKHSR